MKSSLILAGLAITCFAPPALAQLRGELVVSGLSQPVAFVQDPSQSNVQVVAQQGGRIRVVKDGVLLEQDFLDITSQVLFSGERGVLGFVFAPDYASSRRLFVSFTNVVGDTVIARFLRDAGDPLRADPATRFDLVWPDGLPYLMQPWTTHKGGNMVFGPDGYLYVALGDGDRGNNPVHTAQNPGSLLGKMLRMDISVDAAHPTGYTVPATNPFVGQLNVLPEIWSFGYRNPWRFSFDDPSRGGTGALIVADVGEAGFEEVNYEPAGHAGRNYGWKNREGAHNYLLTDAPFPGPLTDPIYEYNHTVGRSVSGGFVYRGSALGGAYVGRYFFADFIFSKLWSIGLAVDSATGEATATDILDHTGELGTAAKNVSSFGIDANGELYAIAYLKGEIYRLVSEGSTPPSPPDPPAPPSSSACTAADPFTSLGGGTCCGGGWLPPGMACAETPEVPSPPAPPTPPDTPESPQPPDAPPPPPSNSSCSTADPFSSMGGGTCCAGGWLPPGMACNAPIPQLPPNPETPLPADPPSPPADPPAPPSFGGACASADPFSSLGGGTCCNGGWLPPGMACSAPAPPPGPPADPPVDPPVDPPADPPVDPPADSPSDPPPPPSDGGCTMPDPFVGLPGVLGVCQDGGWFPTEVINGGATVRFRTWEGGFWAIETDDGRSFVPLDGLPVEFQVDGLRITFAGKLRLDRISVYGTLIELIAIN